MRGRRPYSWCLVGCCLQDLFSIARSILVQLLSSFFSSRCNTWTLTKKVKLYYTTTQMKAMYLKYFGTLILVYFYFEIEGFKIYKIFPRFSLWLQTVTSDYRNVIDILWFHNVIDILWYRNVIDILWFLFQRNWYPMIS